MEKMEIFNESGYLDFIKSVYPYYRTGDKCIIDFIEPTLMKMYEEGKLENNQELKQLIDMFHPTDGETRDIVLGAANSCKVLLEKGYDLKDFINLSHEAMKAVRHSEYDGPFSKSFICKFASYVFKLTSDIKGTEESSLAQPYIYTLLRKTRSRANDSVYGESLDECLRYIESLDETTICSLVSEGYDVNDIICIAMYVKNNSSLEEAKDFIGGFKNKSYGLQTIYLLKSLGISGDVLPVGTELISNIIKGESKFVEDATDLLAKITYVTSIPTNDMEAAAIIALYDAGFSLGLIEKDSTVSKDIFKNLIQLILNTSEQCKTFYGNRCVKLSHYPYNGKVYALVKDDIIFDLLRYTYSRSSVEAITSCRSLNYLKGFLCDWLKQFQVKYICPTNLQYVIDDEFNEIVITLNGKIVYDFPADFFFDYKEEIESYLKSNISWGSFCNIKMQNGMLIIAYGITAPLATAKLDKKAPVTLTLDLATKKNILFSSGCRLDMPILKAMLYQYYNARGKDPAIIETLDLNTVLAMIKTLILQDSEEYESLFNRKDNFISGFKALKYCVRSDDNLYSALLRYALAISSIANEYSNSSISPKLKDYVVMEGTKVPILSVLTSDRSLISYLTEHKDSLRTELKEDVIYFE